MNRRFSPQGIIFDMDGLLVDSEPVWHDVERAFARARGADWTDEMALACTGQGIDRIVQIMGEKLGFDVDVARDVQELEDRFIKLVDTLKLKPFALELLEEARAHLPIALASSSPRRLINASLDRFGIKNHFRVTVSGQEVPHAKPSPDVYLKAAEQLSLKTSACLAIEDSRNGVKAARAAGILVIAVPEGEASGFETIADAIVRDLREARTLIEF